MEVASQLVCEVGHLRDAQEYQLGRRPSVLRYVGEYLVKKMAILPMVLLTRDICPVKRET
jgi:hypothetical protein